MLDPVLKVLIAYLVGGVLGSLVLGRLRGVDIRSMGSGNAGATNALRTQGKLFGLAVLIIDVAKGVLVVRWLPAAVRPSSGSRAHRAQDARSHSPTAFRAARRWIWPTC